MASAYRHPVQEDDGHGVFQHREGERAEEDHGPEQSPADYVAMLHEAGQLGDQGGGLTRDQPLQIPSNVASNSPWSMICDNPISMRMSIGTMDSSV